MWRYGKLDSEVQVSQVHLKSRVRDVFHKLGYSGFWWCKAFDFSIWNSFTSFCFLSTKAVNYTEVFVQGLLRVISLQNLATLMILILYIKNWLIRADLFMNQTTVYCFSSFLFYWYCAHRDFCLPGVNSFFRGDFIDHLIQHKIVLKLKEKHMVRQTKQK